MAASLALPSCLPASPRDGAAEAISTCHCKAAGLMALSAPEVSILPLSAQPYAGQGMLATDNEILLHCTSEPPGLHNVVELEM